MGETVNQAPAPAPPVTTDAQWTGTSASEDTHMTDSIPASTRPARIGIVVTSDRAHAGTYTDLGGPAIRATLSAYLVSPWSDIYRLIPDDFATICTT